MWCAWLKLVQKCLRNNASDRHFTDIGHRKLKVEWS
ncbi:MAG: hypothetical protein ACI90S_000444, partial [Marinobacter psychrophilus]